MIKTEQCRVLILDDSADEVVQMTRAMGRAGLCSVCKRVDNRESFLQALESFKPDVILLDHRLPGFDGVAAIALARKVHPEIPIVVVSYALGDELATALLKCGAKDYVLKSNLGRLATVIRRTLEEEHAIRERKRAERELRDAHALLKKISDTTPVGTLVWGRDGLISFINAEGKRLLGIGDKELLDKQHKAAEWEITDLEGRPIADEDLPHVKVFRTGGAVRMFRMEISTPEGRRKLLVNAAPLHYDNGQVTSVVATLEDVTRLAEAQELLRRREEHLRMALKAARMSTWVMELPSKTISHSDEAAELLGRPPEFKISSFGQFLEIAHPEDREEIISSLENAIANSPQYSAEFRILMLDGTECWFAVQGDVVRDGGGNPTKLVGVIWDCNSRKVDELALKRANRALQVISAVNDQLIHAADVQSLLDAVCRVIVETGGYALAWVGKLEHSPMKRVVLVSQAGQKDNIADLDIRWDDSQFGQGPAGLAIKSREPLVVNDIPNEPCLAPWRAATIVAGYQSGVCLPLVHAGEVLGTLSIYSYEMNAFSPTEVSLLRGLAEDLAFGIANLGARAERDRILIEKQKYQAKLQESLVASIQTLSAMLEMRDPYTAGHQRRVALLSEAIARELGLQEDRIEGLRLAASVHDIGKIRVPAEILNKPGRLKDIELGLIKLHPQTGYEILKDVEFPWPISRMVLEHHERMDGSGYPNGLRGEQTLLESHILMVADVVEAMMSHRPYRPGLGLQAALMEIQAHRGTWYDPAVVDACERIFNEGNFVFESESSASHAEDSPHFSSRSLTMPA